MIRTSYFIGSFLAGTFLGGGILYLATYSPSDFDLRWGILLFPITAGVVFFAWRKLKGLGLPLLLGLLCAPVVFLESRFPVIGSRTAENIGGAWPNNYGEWRLEWRQKAYWLLDFWLLQRRFDPAIWKQSGPDTDFPERLHMIDDLLDENPMRGMSKQEVHELLGRPMKAREFHRFLCKSDPGRPLSADQYPLAWVDNLEHNLIVEYEDDSYQCAYQSFTIIF
ncbi:MAG: hypothetical protein KDK37_11885 [Leptospiraceae bacterium]|nr:hypothetical protein [Leptospiraceae bacterium]